MTEQETPTKGDAFTKKPTDAAAFDVDAWISGIKPATKTVKVSNDAAAVERINELETELHELSAQERREAELEKTLGDEPSKPSRRRVEIAEQIKALHDELAGSWVEVTLIPLTMARYSELLSKHSEDVATAASKGLSETATMNGQELTEEQWRRIHDRIGAGQFSLLWFELQALSNDTVVTPDFSRAVSSILDGQGSSKS